jgi:hypothetical protein
MGPASFFLARNTKEGRHFLCPCQVPTTLGELLVHQGGRAGRIHERDPFQVRVEQQVLKVLDPVRPPERLDVAALQAVEERPFLLGDLAVLPVAPDRPLRVGRAVPEPVDGGRCFGHAHLGQVLAEEGVDKRTLARLHPADDGHDTRLVHLTGQPLHRRGEFAGQADVGQCPGGFCQERPKSEWEVVHGAWARGGRDEREGCLSHGQFYTR